MATAQNPPGAVVRVSKGTFDPARFAEIERMRRETGAYLVPAIQSLDGLRGYYAGTSPAGSIVDVSVWNSDTQASQMGELKEMIVDARSAAEALGVTFIPILNHALSWRVLLPHREIGRGDDRADPA